MAAELVLSGPDETLTAEVEMAVPVFMHGKPSVEFLLTPEAGEAMADLTARMVGQDLTVLLCERELVRATVRERITGRGRINMPSPEAATAVADVMTGDAGCEALEPHFDE